MCIAFLFNVITTNLLSFLHKIRLNSVSPPTHIDTTFSNITNSIKQPNLTPTHILSNLSLATIKLNVVLKKNLIKNNKKENEIKIEVITY